MKLLVIPDSHACPGYDNARFEWLGKFIVAEQPDTIVCLGDFADMPSLSSYDKGKRGYEGRRYKLDVEVTLDAQQRLFAPIEQYNESRRKSGKAKYKPKTVMLLGNHEWRIEKATNDAAELYGTIEIADLEYSRYWDEVWDFREIRIIEGVAFSHYLVPGGGKDTPVGGKNAARSLVTSQLMSCVVGHSHMMDYAEDVRPDGVRIFAVCAGHYGPPEYVEGWCKSTHRRWWAGVTIIDGLNGGQWESLRFVTQDSLKRKYG